MACNAKKTEMKGDRARYCTRAEAKHDSDIVRRQNDKKAVAEGLEDDEPLFTQADERAHGTDCKICHP